MSSIHIQRSMNIALSRGAASGRAEHAELWDLSKRELVEIALRFAALLEGDEEALNDRRALERVRAERDALQSNGIL